MNYKWVFEELEEKAKHTPLTVKERKAYNESLKVYRDNYAIAETEREEGRAEGRAEGREEGRAEGRAEERVEILKDIDILGRELGFSDDKIAELKQKINARRR